AWVVKNIQGNESSASIVSRLKESVGNKISVTQEDFWDRKEQAETDLQRLEEYADGIVGLGDVNFPAHRGNVKNSEQPIVLFYRGDISLLGGQNTNIAVIGHLCPDLQTEAFEKEVVAELVENGVVIISGLARGCDSIAHQQALHSGGKTV